MINNISVITLHNLHNKHYVIPSSLYQHFCHSIIITQHLLRVHTQLSACMWACACVRARVCEYPREAVATNISYSINVLGLFSIVRFSSQQQKWSLHSCYWSSELWWVSISSWRKIINIGRNVEYLARMASCPGSVTSGNSLPWRAVSRIAIARSTMLIGLAAW